MEYMTKQIYNKSLITFLFMMPISLHGALVDMVPTMISSHPIFSFVDAKYSNHEVYRALSPCFLCLLAEAFHADTFIESGTYQGDTPLVAAPFFKIIHTIELSPLLHKAAQERLKNLSHIHVHQGNSPTVLRAILPSLVGRKIVFWLDGHYSAGTTARGDSNCPILEELAAIKENNIRDAIIVIDDVRLFAVEEEWPSLKDVVTYIVEINPSYRGIIIGDILVAYPDNPTISISEVVRACSMSRIYAEEPFKKALLNEAEITIQNAQGVEREYICDLYNRFSTDPYYTLWYDLIKAQ
jgi:hypothetical protein